MNKFKKSKIETYIPIEMKNIIIETCLKKGITLSEALKRALDIWIKNENNK